MHLENKVALVSGVGPGMGSAIAMLFAQEGASVTLAARKTNVIQPLADDIHKLTGQEALALQLDAGKRSEIQNAVEQTVEKFGRLDIFVSLPGGGFSVPDALVDTEEDYFQEMLDNHLTTLFHGARAVIPHLKESEAGSIITLAAGSKTRRDGHVAYGMAKEGVIGFTRNLARELHPYGIRVNCIGAGLIRQPLKPGLIELPAATLARKGQPEDIAFTALYLASGESRWVTGQIIVVDGGDEILAGQPRPY